MNLFKYVYAASIAMMLTAFIACGDDNSSSADDIISDLSPEIDITDSSSSGLPSSSTDNSSIDGTLIQLCVNVNLGIRRRVEGHTVVFDDDRQQA